MVSGYEFGEIAWHKNDGNENFITYMIGNTSKVLSVYATDIDSDGDIDVLSAASLGGAVSWYENDGYENFTQHAIIIISYTSSVYAIDLDGDGDIDVLSASGVNDMLNWYENDGNENFTTHTISTDNTYSIYAIDVDGDGDNDVLAATYGDNKIVWYENDGSGNFTLHTITTNAYAAVSVFAIDMDRDGDIDVVSSYLGESPTWYGGIAWYENLLIVNNVESDSRIPTTTTLYDNYPNPFNPTTKIKYHIPEFSFVTLKVYDVLGNEIETIVNEEKQPGSYEVEFNATDLPSGIYFYQLRTGDFVETKKMILLR